MGKFILVLSKKNLFFSFSWFLTLKPTKVYILLYMDPLRILNKKKQNIVYCRVTLNIFWGPAGPARSQQATFQRINWK